MIRSPLRAKAFCWMAIALAVNLCVDPACMAWTVKPAVEPSILGSDDGLQSLAADGRASDSPGTARLASLLQAELVCPLALASFCRVQGDTTGAAPGEVQISPLWKKWWVWAIGGGVIVTTLAFLAGGDEPREPLPDFPPPPDR